MTELFTPKNSALLMIDHQVGTMQLIKNIDVAQDVGGLCQCDRHLLAHRPPLRQQAGVTSSWPAHHGRLPRIPGHRGLGGLGADQLAWLADDLKDKPASTPIVVFAHIPLWTVYADWGWGTDDGLQALISAAGARNCAFARPHDRARRATPFGARPRASKCAPATSRSPSPTQRWRGK
jgi:3',5'-cyclic AMP phosphodiesterase CpdA